MASIILVLSPVIFLIIVALIYGIVIYREYRTSYENYGTNREYLEGTYLKILVQSDIRDLADNDVELREFDEGEENFMRVPSELVAYNFLLNPIRLAIMKTLYDAIKYPAADLRNELDISWGKFTPHVNQLIRRGFISSEDEFINSNPRKVLILESEGSQQYASLENILRTLFS